MEPDKSATISVPSLRNREAFEAALKDYRISDEGHKILLETPFTAMVAPTATGRNTIISLLIKTGNYHFIVSDTTRPPRYNHGILERDGVEYFFRTEDEILADIKAGRYVEAEIIHKQQVSGISIREIKKAQSEGKIAITDVDILGAVNMTKLKPDAAVIYLLPPSFDEWLRRIHGRSHVTDGELRNRLEGALKGFRLALANDNFIFVVNDKLEDAVRRVDEISRLHIRHPAQEAAAHKLAKQLRAATETYLAQMPA